MFILALHALAFYLFVVKVGDLTDLLCIYLLELKFYQNLQIPYEFMKTLKCECLGF